MSDLRLALRSLAKSPGFAAVAVLSLALGIGACTAVYSVVDGLLLRPIGHDDHTERELQLFETREPDLPLSRVSPANFFDWQRRATSFSALRAGTGTNLVLTGAGEPLRLTVGKATHQLLEPHAWTLAHGRGFLPEEDVPGQNKVVIINHGLWQRLFAGDPQAIGRSLELDGEPHRIVGILSVEVGRFLPVDAFVPLALTDAERTQRGNRSLGAWARLKPGVTVEAARAEMKVIAAQLAAEHPATNRGWSVSLVPVAAQQGAAGLRDALWTLLGAVGCVLLIACANVANLLLARATVRQQEMAVRTALGAGRARLMRQLLTESMLLALLGGGIGVLFAHGALQAVHAYAGPGMERLGFLRLDAGVLGLAVALSVATGLVFGVAPAWFATRVDLNAALKQKARGTTGGRSRARLRNTLVVLEVALALVLLAGAGSLIRRLVERAQLDPGFAPENATALQVNLPRAKYPTAGQQLAFADAVAERLRGLPGVQAAGVTTALPTPQPGVGFALEGHAPQARSDWPKASVYAVTPEYLPALGLRVLRGRPFTTQDRAQAPRVALVNQMLAAQYFPGEDPIGRRIKLASGGDSWREIVGLVADAVQFGADTGIAPQVYEPFAQAPGLNLGFVVRTARTAPADAAASAAIIRELKRQVYAVDKDQPVLSVRPLQEVLDERIAGQRFAMHLLTAFSFVALLIAAIGIYAVVAYTVSQRAGEIGIRMALGAQRRDVLRLVLGFAGRIVGLGLVAGIGAAAIVGRTLAAMLYGVDARDPAMLAIVTLVLGGVALLACWLPALRATKVDPMVALRAE